MRCPLPDHPDKDASAGARWVPETATRAGRLLVECRKCGKDRTEDLLAVLGLRFADIYDDVPGVPADPARRRGTGGTLSAGGGAKSSRRAVLPPGPLAGKAAPPPTETLPSKVVARYQFVTADGELVAEQARRETTTPDPKTGKPAKSLAWRVPDARKRNGWRYGLPDGLLVPLYNLPAVVEAAQAGGTVYVVEGCKNADDVIGAGAVATTAPHGSTSEWPDSYVDALAGAHVIVVADRDADGYTYAARVRDVLAGRAASVRVVHTPLELEKGDASDHLAAGLALDALEDVPTARLQPIPAVNPDDDGGRVLDFPGAGGDQADGQPPAAAKRRGSGGGAGQVPRILSRDRFELYSDADRDAVVRIDVKRDADGHPIEIARELLNCRAYITGYVMRDLDDDTPPTKTHVDVVAERAGQRVVLENVPWKEFRSAEFLGRVPWQVSWTDTAAGRSALKNAIEEVSGVVPVVTSYGTLGWRQIEDRWVYIHAAGGIDTTGSVPGVRVDVDQRLRGFTMPDPPSTAETVRAALDSVLLALDRLPARMVAPVFGGAFRAMLGESRLSVFLNGYTATRKSGLAALAQQVFTPGARHNKMPVGAGEAATTVTAAEELMYMAAHTLLFFDDLAPDRGVDRSAKRGNELMRAAGNGTMKARGAREGGLRADRPPRALMGITGEDGGSVLSAESRTVYVLINKGDIPQSAMRTLSTPARIAGRNALGAALAQYLAARMPLDDWLEENRPRYALALLGVENEDDEIPDDDGITTRRADSVADLACGWRALLDMATDTGALSADEAAGVWSRVWAGLVECLGSQQEMTERRSLAERAADMLRSVLRAQRGHLASRDTEGEPPRLGACGWTAATGGTADFGSPARPNGPRVGWTDGKVLLLDPGAAFTAIEHQADAEHDSLGVSRRAFARALLHAGVLTTGTPATPGARPLPTVPRTIGGVQQRVWEIPWSWLYPTGEDTAGPQSGPTGPDGGTPPTPDPLPIPTPPARAESVPDAPTAAPGSDDTPQATPAAQERTERPAGGVASQGKAAQNTGRTADRAAVDYRAPGVVVDVDSYAIAGGPAEPLPAGLDSLATVLEWAEGLNLGTAQKGTRDDAGQVWIMPALAKRLKFPAREPVRGSKAATTTHPLVKGLRAAGWSIGRQGLGAWTHVWRENSRSLQMVVVGWQRESEMVDADNPPAVEDLAFRLDMFRQTVGMPYLISTGATGTALLKVKRAASRKGPLQMGELPPPALESQGRRWEQEWGIQRAFTAEEVERYPVVVGYDVNAQYLAAAGVVELGIGDARHVQAPTMPGKLSALPPGYWRIERCPSPDPLLLDLLTPAGSDDDGPSVWVTTPTLREALEAGYPLAAPSEAWLYSDKARWLEEWAHSLRDARYVLDDLAAGAGDAYAANLRALLKTVKLTYAAGVGMLGSFNYRKGTPEFRPDARHHVIGTAKANLYRKAVRAAREDGRYPLAITRDAIYYPAESVEAAPPAGFTLGRKLGQVKPAGALTVDDQLVAAFAASRTLSAESVGRIAETDRK